jgi:hypothetical protein
VRKEYTDLEGSPLWREEAIKRFKMEMKKLGNENKIADYLVKDLQKFGYVPKYKQRAGFRVEDISSNRVEEDINLVKDNSKDIIKTLKRTTSSDKFKELTKEKQDAN